MCELNVYMTDNDERVMEGAVRLVVTDDKIFMEDIIGRSTEITGRIKEVDITSQKVLVDRL